MTVELQEAIDNDNHVHGTLHVGMLVSDVTTSVSRMGKQWNRDLWEKQRSANIFSDFLAFSEISHCDSE